MVVTTRLNQLQALTHICSVWVEKSPDGKTVTDLLAEIGQLLKGQPPGLYRRVKKIVYKTVGNPNQPAVASLQFQEIQIEGEKTLKLYPVDRVPSVQASAAVRNVDFLSDLSGTDAMTDDELDSAGGLVESWQ